MKKNNSLIFRVNKSGELVQDNLHDIKKLKYKSDTPFLFAVMSYILMLACTVIDGGFFYSLFARISYDNPFMLVLQVFGLAFAADIVAAYAGIYAKRLKQGLVSEKFILVMLIIVPVAALIINTILRISIMSVSSSNGTVDAETKALAIISIAMPWLTSFGNFAISYFTYDPLLTKIIRCEYAIDDIKENIRRLKAVVNDYKADEGRYEMLLEQDKKRKEIAVKDAINDACSIVDSVGIELAKQLSDPTATNILTKSNVENICDRLKKQIETLGGVNNTAQQQTPTFTLSEAI